MNPKSFARVAVIDPTVSPVLACSELIQMPIRPVQNILRLN